MKYNFDWGIIQKCRKNRTRKEKSRKEYQHEYYLRVTKPKRMHNK